MSIAGKGASERRRPLRCGSIDASWTGSETPMSVPDIQLHQSLRETFHKLDRALSPLFQEGAVRMGGGSILAALWQHRLSTDIDLSMPLASWMEAQQGNPGIFREMAGALFDANLIAPQDLPDPSTLRIGTSLQLHSGERIPGCTPWSLCTSISESSNPAADGPVRHIENTAIVASPLHRIMHGKLFGRMGRRRAPRGDAGLRTPQRDLYDIAVCMAREPEVIAEVLEGKPGEMLRQVVQNLRKGPRDPTRANSGRPIIQGTYKVEMAGIGERIANALEAGDLSLMPVAKRVPRRAPSRSDPP